ncbi:hypothetical protein LCGC14_1702720, partial [marine sediment metagenome]
MINRGNDRLSAALFNKIDTRLDFWSHASFRKLPFVQK